MQRMGIAFAGSSHTKYAGYTLEMIVNLELESSPALKETFLKNWLVNPSGEPGRWVEGDLHLEHINLILETMIEHKDAEWDAPHIRTVVAPNVSHFVTLKNTYREGLGLAKRRGTHTSPHCRPEVKALVEAFKVEDIHRFRAGRHYGPEPNVPPQKLDLFARGLAALREGRLDKWKADSRARRKQSVPHRTGQATISEPGMERPQGSDTGAGEGAGAGAAGDLSQRDGQEGDDEDDEGEAEEMLDLDEDQTSLQTEGMLVYDSGELVIDYGDWSISDALAAGEDELDIPDINSEA